MSEPLTETGAEIPAERSANRSASAGARWAELLLLFFAVPALFAWWRATGDSFQNWLASIGAPDGLVSFVRPRSLMFPLLYGFMLICTLLLVFDKTFDNRRFWGVSGFKKEAPRVLVMWLIGAAGIGAATWIFHPDWLFRLPRSIPLLWVMIMILYPILSVYPQGVLYRLFFFHRYETILKPAGALIFVNALAFGWMHIVFLNWIAPAMCFAGGLLFAVTYHRTRSALAAALEHALYGCWIFTVGLGLYFFGGAEIDENGRVVPPQRTQEPSQPPAD